MRLLLDTHTLIWLDSADRRLSKAARAALDAEGAELIVSAATIWEMAIKAGRGRLTLRLSLPEYVLELGQLGYRMLPVSAEHAAAVILLPDHHRDPFDRMLAAQARAERLPCVTRDKIFKKYGVEVIW